MILYRNIVQHRRQIVKGLQDVRSQICPNKFGTPDFKDSQTCSGIFVLFAIKVSLRRGLGSGTIYVGQRQLRAAAIGAHQQRAPIGQQVNRAAV
jgi:hypothetical protein